METPAATNPPNPGLPIAVAVISVFYAGIATLAAGAVWETVGGAWHVPLWWALVWAIVGAAASVGLALLKAWARKLARATSVLLAILGLWVATACVAAHQPLLGISASVFGGIQMAAYYYLRRPVIKAFFA